MPRGGKRVGAGRPPKDGTLALVHGSRDRGTRPAGVASAAPPAASSAPVGEPEGLPDDQRAVWASLAPHAHAQGTLTAETALAFRDLCEAIVVKRSLLAIIQVDGYTIQKVTVQTDEKGGALQNVEPKAHPLLSQFRGLMQRVETGMARFRLTPDGKEHVAPAAPKELSALEKLQAQARTMKRG
jgi:hypothetical protein